jgi:YhcH/YjgK/YiaL family protein
MLIMIIDHIRNAQTYCNITPGIAIGLKFLIETDFNSLGTGRYELPGSDAYALVQEHNTRQLSEVKWEVHRKYIDLQFIVHGEEWIRYADIESLKMGEFHESDDYALGEGEGDFLKLGKGYFMLLFPQDGHMPSMTLDRIRKIKKVVVKIPV